MLSKPQKSIEHNLLEILSGRMVFSTELKSQLNRLINGYKGELIFSNLLADQLPDNTVKLFDITLNINGSLCQVDCLLFFQSKLFLFEIKHYSGEYILENDNWYTLNKTEIRNPLHQLKRTELLVKQLLKKYNIKITLESFLVFTHPEFHLYNAPPNLPILLPSQLNRFIKKLQKIPNLLNPAHQDFITILYSLHEPTFLPMQKIHYDFNQLYKGVVCKRCQQIMIAISPKLMHCTRCYDHENIEESINRSIHEYRLLFPDSKITLKLTSKWINHVASYHYLRKVFSQDWITINKGSQSHYLPRKDNNDFSGLTT